MLFREIDLLVSSHRLIIDILLLHGLDCEIAKTKQLKWFMRYFSFMHFQFGIDKQNGFSKHCITWQRNGFSGARPNGVCPRKGEIGRA